MWNHFFPTTKLESFGILHPVLELPGCPEQLAGQHSCRVHPHSGLEALLGGCLLALVMRPSPALRLALPWDQPSPLHHGLGNVQRQEERSLGWLT